VGCFDRLTSQGLVGLVEGRGYWAQYLAVRFRVMRVVLGKDLEE
jgi:hypothetical protein